jgi:hypothetical protein
MNKQQMTTSVALFCKVGDKAQERIVPFAWLEKAVELFHRYALEPILFTASGGDFEYDDCYVLADAGHDLVRFGEVLSARREDLMAALRNGDVEYLGLDSPSIDSACRSDWRASIDVSAWQGEIYAGLEDGFMTDPVALLRWAFGIAKQHFDVRYGIAYKMPLSESPASYASGSRSFSFADFQQMLRDRKTGIDRLRSPDELWADERNERRRHLTGLFRGAYPASILSDAHVQAAQLHAHAIGKLSKLDTSLWLWELSESEIPKAEAMLRAENTLVSQMTQQ